jgi:hypothetical protein
MNAHFPKKPSPQAEGPSPETKAPGPVMAQGEQAARQPSDAPRASGASGVKAYDGLQRRKPMPNETRVRFETHFGSIQVHLEDSEVYSAIREAVIANGGPDPALDEGTALISYEDLQATLGDRFHLFTDGAEDTFTLDTFEVANFYGYDAADSILKGGITEALPPPSRTDIGMAWWHLSHEISRLVNNGGKRSTSEENLKGSLAVLRSALSADPAGNRGGDALGLMALERLEGDLLNSAKAQGRTPANMRVDLNLVRLPLHASPRTSDPVEAVTVGHLEASLGMVQEILADFEHTGLHQGYHRLFLAKQTVLLRQIEERKEGQFAADWREKTVGRGEARVGTAEEALNYLQQAGLSMGYGYLLVDHTGRLDAHLKFTPRSVLGEEHAWSLREIGKLSKFGRDFDVVYYETLPGGGNPMDAIETISNRLSWLKEAMASMGPSVRLKDALVVTKGDGSEAASLFEQRNVTTRGHN